MDVAGHEGLQDRWVRVATFTAKILPDALALRIYEQHAMRRGNTANRDRYSVDSDMEGEGGQ